MTYILGISGGFRLGYQDAAAVLVSDGMVVAAIEEERLSRVKHAPSVMPYFAIKEVLQIAGISIEQVAEVATHGITWGDEYREDVRQYFITYFGFCPKLSFWHHHMAHAAGAFYSSGFSESMILTLDNSGDGISTQLAVGKGQSIEVVEQYARPQSLGIFYSSLTQYCGFKKESDEYKLMGLAAYAKGHNYDLSPLLSISQGHYKLDDEYIFTFQPGRPQPSQQQRLYSDKLSELVGTPPRIPGSEISDNYIQLAAATQEKFEEALISLVQYLHEKTGLRSICLSGGAALNCVANGKIAKLDFIDEIYVQPAASDAGIAMGAAQLASANNGNVPASVASTYLGREFSDSDILKILKLTNVSFKKIENVAKEAAKYLAQDKVIGWFQGRAEFGPRALGNRSILASATKKEMVNTINQKIKFRESFRPFCPAVLEEGCQRFFDVKKTSSPYMTITFPSKPLALDLIPAAVHADGSARIQTVTKEMNELFYNLLTEYKQVSGVGVVLNTSFNRNNEPIVDSPVDALSTFFGSGLDALFIGNYLVLKS